ncbi:MAG: cob(I)yrinic acid a,c-diamide adenosyltransferase [Bdellovibrionota bacterium]
MGPKIYTRSGDAGMTSLVGGTRVSKTDLRIESYGTLDELNSILGIVRSELQTHFELKNLDQQLEQTQNRLFNLGSLLACESAKLQPTLPQITEIDITNLENWIDTFQAELEPLKEFILPGGHITASFLHQARTVCRRAERHMIYLYDDRTIENAIYLKYVNRLSDYLFVAARFCNKTLKISDSKWKKD